MPPRRRVELLIQALYGLAALHENRVIHRDFTLRNILLEGKTNHAYLFDFDLAIHLDDIGRVTYKNHYQGRIFGSPGYSVPPEVLDPQLTDTAITTRLDTFAIGAAIYTLFTDQLPYGTTEDMWGLLVRIADGVVTGGNSSVDYPDAVPHVLRPIIEACLERDPGQRAGSVNAVAERLVSCLDQLGSAAEARHTTLPATETTLSPAQRVDSVHQNAPDKRVLTKEIILAVDSALNRYGYVVKKALGQVKTRSIFLATPDPELVATGQFPDANTFPKIVTAQDLKQVPNSQEVLDLWFGRYLPVLHSARQGLMTTLYRAVFDEDSGHLFLFSEFVDDPRFGTALEEVDDMTLPEALGLGYLVARQVSRLHDQGMAHNNVSPAALLLKGIPNTRQVHPAMVGLVDPSIEPEALVADVRKLAGLVLSWVHANKVEALDPRLRAIIDDLRHRLATYSFNESVAPPSIQGFVGAIADGLSALDYNFAVLREHGGDLDAYALLLVSHSLYSRLWD
jgi:tRNA A-37 threonylcarbamoyl transferase component Bud32